MARLRGKILVILLCLIAFLSHVSIGAGEPAFPKIPFAEAMKNPKGLCGEPRSFDQGIVVFKKQKIGYSIVVVAQCPFPKLKSGQDFADNQLIAIKVHQRDFNGIKIGDVITTNGKVQIAKKNGQPIHYIRSDKTMVCGHENLEDPRFGAFSEAVKQKYDNDDHLLIFLLAILPRLPRK